MNTVKMSVKQFQHMTRYKITKEETLEIGNIVLPDGITLVPFEHGLQIVIKDSDMNPYINLRAIQNNLAAIVFPNFKVDLEGNDTIIFHDKNISWDICPRKEFVGKKLWKFWIRKEESVWAQDPYQFNVCIQIFKDNQ